MDLKAVPDETDQERVEREAKYIEKQADKINEAIQGSAVTRRDRDEYANLMRKKLIGYGVLGIIVLLGVSLGFFANLRKIFKERKMI